MPGLKEELNAEQEEALLEWFRGSRDDLDTFHSRKWWMNLFDNSDDYEVVMDFNLDCFDKAWNDWFESGHEYGMRDKVYFDRGLDEYLSFIGIVIRKTH